MPVPSKVAMENVEVNDFRVYDGGRFIFASPSYGDAEMDFNILKEKLEKYKGAYIEWQGCLLGSGAYGSVVRNANE